MHLFSKAFLQVAFEYTVYSTQVLFSVFVQQLVTVVFKYSRRTVLRCQGEWRSLWSKKIKPSLSLTLIYCNWEAVKTSILIRIFRPLFRKFLKITEKIFTIESIFSKIVERAWNDLMTPRNFTYISRRAIFLTTLPVPHNFFPGPKFWKIKVISDRKICRNRKFQLLESIYLFEVKNRNTRWKCEICAKLNDDVLLVYLSLTLNILHTFFQRFYCWL